MIGVPEKDKWQDRGTKIFEGTMAKNFQNLFGNMNPDLKAHKPEAE